jgi:hypothetical protein
MGNLKKFIRKKGTSSEQRMKNGIFWSGKIMLITNILGFGVESARKGVKNGKKIAISGHFRAIFDPLPGRFNPKTQCIRDQHNFSCGSTSRSHFVPHSPKKFHSLRILRFKEYDFLQLSK